MMLDIYLCGTLWEDKGAVNGFFEKNFLDPHMGPIESKKVF